MKTIHVESALRRIQEARRSTALVIGALSAPHDDRFISSEEVTAAALQEAVEAHQQLYWLCSYLAEQLDALPAPDDDERNEIKRGARVSIYGGAR